MSTMQRLTLIGLYNYENSIGGDLFVNLTLPEGYDKSVYINSLLLEHGEKCVMYTDPDFFKSAISMWSSKWANELKRIYDALTAKYNPIWNYDRNEEYATTDKPDNTMTRTHNDTDTQTNRYDVVTTQNIDGVSENKISADNASDYQPDNKNTFNSGKTTVGNDGTITDAHTGTITDTEKGTRSNIEHKGHTWGNIGVTTSSQMVEQETELRVKNNLYSITTALFANELLLGIY